MARKKKILKSAEAVEAAQRALSPSSPKQRHSSQKITFADSLRRAVKSQSEAMAATTRAEAFKRRWVFTGIIEYDLNIGFTYGSRIQIVGDPHMGKTASCYQLIAAFQRSCRQCLTPILPFLQESTGEIAETCLCGEKDPGRALYVDVEKEFDPSWAATLGVRVHSQVRNQLTNESEQEDHLAIDDGATFGVLRIQSGETAGDIIEKLMRESAVDLVVIDSLAMLSTRESNEGKKQPADLARALSRIFRSLMAAQSTAWINEGVAPTLMWTNQYRMNIDIRNPKADPRKEAGGQANKYVTMQTARIYTRFNEGLPLGLPNTHADITLTIKKDKLGGSTGMTAAHRLYLRDYRSGKGALYKAGSTNEPVRLFDQIKKIAEGNADLELAPDPRWFCKTKSGYQVVGSIFKNVAEIHQYLSRPDIQYMLRYPIMRKLLPESAKAHLDKGLFTYSPFYQELGPLCDIIENDGPVSRVEPPKSIDEDVDDII